MEINVVAKIKQFRYLSQGKLYENLTVLKTVCIDLLVERDIPEVSKCHLGRPLHLV